MNSREAIAFRNNIKKFRIKNGFSYRALGRLFGDGMNGGNTIMLESGQREPKLSTLICYSRAMGIPLAKLFK